MSSVETPILTSDNSLEKEEIVLSSTTKLIKKCILGIVCTILTVGTGALSYDIYSAFGFSAVLPGLISLVGIGGIIISLCIPERVKVEINNTKKTLKIQKICNCCCKKSPRIIYLNEIKKIDAIHSSFEIVYENGLTENISDYFSENSEHSLFELKKMLKKYLVLNTKFNAINKLNVNNQNIPIQQNLPVNDGVSKPTNSENYEAPSAPQ